MLPPGRARLATTPAPVGSDTSTNISGIVRVSCCSAFIAGVVFVKMTSGLRPLISWANRGRRS